MREHKPIANQPKKTPGRGSGEDTPLVTLCVIACDEEVLLPRCLASVCEGKNAGTVDEIVVVDTGSSDQTIAVAQRFGARVVSHVWSDDFAKARNAALQNASGQYVFILDADECLIAGAGAALRRCAEEGQADLGLLCLHHASTLDCELEEVVEGNHRQGEPLLVPRLFRRSSDLRWEGVVYETIDGWLESAVRTVAALDVDVVNLGRVPTLLPHRGSDIRNLRLLQNKCLNRPNDAASLTFLARELLRHNEAARGQTVLEKAWKAGLSQSGGGRPVTLCTLHAQLHLSQGDGAGAQQIVQTARAWECSHPNIDLLEGLALEMCAHQSWDDAEKELLLGQAVASFEAAIGVAGHRFQEDVMPGASGHLAWVHLGAAAVSLADWDAAKEAFGQASQSSIGRVGGELGRAEVSLRMGDGAGCLSILDRVLPEGGGDAWVLAACAAERQGFTADFLTFVTRAQEEVRKTGLMLHRRSLFMELVLMDRMCRGRPQFGPGVLGQLGALMAGEPFPRGVEAGLGVPVEEALIERLIGHLMELDQVHLVNALISSRAEQAFPGLLKQVTSSLRNRGASVHDDGEMSLVCVVGDARAGSEVARLLGRHPDMHAIDGRKFKELLEELRNHLIEQVDTVRGLDEAVERVSGRELDDAAKVTLEDWFAKHSVGPKESSAVCFVPEGAKYWATIRRLLPMAKLIEVSCISGEGGPGEARVAPTTKVSDRTLTLSVHSLEQQLQSCLTMALAFADEAWFSLEKLS